MSSSNRSVIGYSRSFRHSIRSTTESLYDRARKKLTSSFRGGVEKRRKSEVRACVGQGLSSLKIEFLNLEFLDPSTNHPTVFQHVDQYTVSENFTATEEGLISVKVGQRVEVS